MMGRQNYDLEPLVTHVEVSAVPVGNPERHRYRLLLSWWGRDDADEWLIRRDEHTYIDRDGTESTGARYGDERWLAAHVMTYDEAVEVAQQVAPTLTCNGYTVDDGIRMGEARLSRATEHQDREPC